MGIASEHRHGSYGYRKDELRRRLSRIEGQVRGLARMIEDEKYCVDILTQVAAVQAALERVSLGVLEDHMKGCIGDAADAREARARIEELTGVIERFVALKR